MKIVSRSKWFAACLLATATIAHAQSGGSAAATANASAPVAVASPVSAKAQRAANRQLAKNVRQALARTKNLNIVNVTVRAKQGVVTLQGSMPDNGQIEQAAKIASAVSGVASVKNDLTTIRQAQ
ncbi:BON domain-containing protein [Paraburkholderia aromaticivorans]|uniref:BON domain-containing protein n=1 Tax=Paraburkholderia aromaticivorans TaxID=2026199 RepID=UPI0014560260|nr:BON domain-containing protein [Paraburkholderia aromaticivorans]